MISVTEQLDIVTKLLRKMCRTYPDKLPDDIQAWWDGEQAIIAAEKMLSDQRKADKVAALTAKITDLQAQLAGLS